MEHSGRKFLFFSAPPLIFPGRILQNLVSEVKAWETDLYDECPLA